MASISEFTFGQRYTKAQGMLEYVKQLPTYKPTSTGLSIGELEPFIKSADESNTAVNNTKNTLSDIRKERYELYYGTTGLVKRSARIRDYIASHADAGKKDRDFQKLQKLTQKMGSKKPPKKTAPSADPSTTEEKKKVSQSELSFGSLLAVGKEILEVIKGIASYAPSTETLQVNKFDDYLKTIDTKNSAVAAAYERYDDSVEQRWSIYDELSKRITKIISYITSEYGKDSQQYKDSLKYKV